jgi:hypothetical protein
MSTRANLPGLGRLLLGLLAAWFGLGLLLVVMARPKAAESRPVPDWSNLLPPPPEGTTLLPAEDLSSGVAVLNPDYMALRRYLSTTETSYTLLSLYLVYWSPGRVAVSHVAAHTPDTCWPGVGWVPVPAATARQALPLAGRDLPAAQTRLFRQDHHERHVWFWHWHGRENLDYPGAYSFRQLLQLAWRYGYRPNEEQLFIRISSNRPWEEIADHQVLLEFFQRLRVHGI